MHGFDHKLPIFTVVVCAFHAAGQPLTWKVADGGNGHRYEAIHAPGGITWQQARTDAEALGGHLVTLNSSGEAAWVFANVATTLPSNGGNPSVGPWIGLFQDDSAPDFVEPDGGWSWVTEEPVDFTDWSPGEPNNSNGGTEAFAHLVADSGRWNDIANDNGTATPIGFIVEYPPLDQAIYDFDFRQYAPGPLAGQEGWVAQGSSPIVIDGQGVAGACGAGSRASVPIEAPLHGPIGIEFDVVANLNGCNFNRNASLWLYDDLDQDAVLDGTGEDFLAVSLVRSSISNGIVVSLATVLEGDTESTVEEIPVGSIVASGDRVRLMATINSIPDEVSVTIENLTTGGSAFLGTFIANTPRESQSPRLLMRGDNNPFVMERATLTVGEPEPCVADTNGDGSVTPADFNAWILAYVLREPACDQNGDGVCNPSDFNAWVVNFNNGC